MSIEPSCAGTTIKTRGVNGQAHGVREARRRRSQAGAARVQPLGKFSCRRQAKGRAWQPACSTATSPSASESISMKMVRAVDARSSSASSSESAAPASMVALVITTENWPKTGAPPPDGPLRFRPSSASCANKRRLSASRYETFGFQPLRGLHVTTTTLARDDTSMSQGPTFSQGAGDGAAAGRLEKQRSALFASSEKEKAKLVAESAAYRLQKQDDKFASTVFREGALAQATVGLVSKEEFARRRAEIEGGGGGGSAAGATEDDGSTVAATAKEEKKKKKKKGGGGALSFAFDDEGGDDGDADGAPPPPKKKAKSAPSAADSSTSEAATAATTTAAATAAASSSSAAASAAAHSADAPLITPLPSGYTCLKAVGSGVVEVSVEVKAGTSVPFTRVVRISEQSVALDVRVGEGGDNAANAALSTFLRTVLGGAPAVTCEVVRGFRAPVKTLRVQGVASADLAYHRLRLASNFRR